MCRRNLTISWLIIVICIITGCGKTPEKESIVKIRWLADNNPIRKEQIAIAERQNPDFKVEIDWANVGLQKLLTQTAGGIPPDVSMIYSFEDFITLCQKGVLEDLTQYCEKYNMDMKDFWPGLKPFIYYEGKVYGFPEVVSTSVLYYNKKIFDEEGIPYPNGEKWTWDDFLAIAQRFTKRDATGRVRRYGVLFSNLDIKMNLLWQNGARFFSEDRKRCTVDSPEFIEAVEFVYDLRFKYHVTPNPVEWDSIQHAITLDSMVGIFAVGNAAMFIGDRFHTGFLREFKDIEWDIALLPWGRQKKAFLNTHTNVIPKDSKNKDAAFRFLMSLVKRESSLLIANHGEAVPPLVSVATSEEFLFNPEFPKETKNHLYLERLKYAEAMSEYSPYVSPIEVKRVIEEEEGKLWAEKQSVEDTCRNIAKSVNKLMEMMRK